MKEQYMERDLPWGHVWGVHLPGCCSSSLMMANSSPSVSGAGDEPGSRGASEDEPGSGAWSESGVGGSCGNASEA